MYSLDDTIAAISTPIGEGGIGIVRLSGPAAVEILQRLFVPASAAPLQARTLRYGHVLDPTTEQRVDEVLAAYMPAPHTYTRQDVVEINGHGGIVPLRRVLELCLRCGARLAEPGEFTLRAFLNGRLDLAQAEAVRDVVQAKTEAALRAAVDQLDGRLSDQVRAIRAALLDALAWVEASIDFDVDDLPPRDLTPELAQASARLEALLTSAERGIIYRQGIRVAIVGRPNVGKSSLLNRLLGTSRAIVTDIPGTTRDTLEETLNLQGIPVVLVDTAGIAAATRDPVERLGIERSQAALAQADLALLVLDASEPLTDADWTIAGLIDSRPAITVLNKIDLLAAEMPRLLSRLPSRLRSPAVPISALTGEGLDALEEAIVDQVLSGQVITSNAPLVTHPRHQDALARAHASVEAAQAALGEGLPADCVAIDLTGAVNALGEITGQTVTDDLLETIFGKFCIGK